MDTQPLSGLPQLLSHIIGDMAQALCQRCDEPDLRQAARAQATAQSILAFQPGDAVEAMIAGHCVMFHELIVDSVQSDLHGGLEATRRATRSSIVAMDRAFGVNLVRLEKYQARRAERVEEATPADARAETEVADRVRRHQGGTASTALWSEAATMELAALVADGASAWGSSSPGIVNAVTPPLDTPHLAPPPEILGVDHPFEAYSEAATQMPGLNRQARREIGRQSRKRIDPGMSPVANANFGRSIRS